ncbi:MAG: UDP-N-acetylmuramate dehydrogenase [Coriobacteriales bacterium]|nr:UDP-N-acetylmuramate dehydrogenase [Coriobacteriales bacterium]
MARHTTFRIGGPADLFIQADCVSDLSALSRILGEDHIEWTVLGKGSNLLVSDEGYRGAVVVLGRDFRRHSIVDSYLHSGAAVALATLVQDAFSAGMSGLEFAVGIPGTVGGALAMNAGSRDEWIGGVVESVTLFVPGQGLRAIRGHEVPWGYRRTDLASRGIIVETVLRLAEGDAGRIRRAMEASLSRRKRSQPLGLPNAGSVFVNPEGDSAGRLIEAAGLKGARQGGAQVSDVHANFIVNSSGATARDVAMLMKRLRDAIRDQYGIELTPEVRFLGSFDAA